MKNETRQISMPTKFLSCVVPSSMHAMLALFQMSGCQVKLLKGFDSAKNIFSEKKDFLEEKSVLEHNQLASM